MSILMRGRDSIDYDSLNKLLQNMASADALLCPTLSIGAVSEDGAAENENLDEQQKKQRELTSIMSQVSCSFVRKMGELGVKLLVGQDGFQSHRTLAEMELMAQCGISEAEIIRGATIYPATWLGVIDKVGALEVGKLANILILNQNPLENIARIHNRYAVFYHGKLMTEK